MGIYEGLGISELEFLMFENIEQLSLEGMTFQDYQRYLIEQIEKGIAEAEYNIEIAKSTILKNENNQN